MKKIFVFLICLLLMCGCNKNNEKEIKKVVSDKILSSVDVKKSYYAFSISYINHDDYYDFAKQEVNILNYAKDDSSPILIETNASENTIVDINLDANESEELEENTKQDIEVIVEEEVLEVENDIVEIWQEENIENETSVEEEKEDKNIELIKDIEPIYETNSESIIDSVVLLDTNEETKEGYYSPIGKYLGDTNVKVIDVSYYQGDINWDLFAKESDCYGVILRLGYYDTLDKKFEQNIRELKRLNIPYGIYLFSYATTMNGSNKEANFTNDMIDKYDLKPELGIYYDIESWSAKNGATSDVITKDMYDNIISNYINKVSSHTNNNYKVKVYSGRWYAMNRLGDIAKSYVDWVAEYNSTCKYDGNYSMWQYTSKGSVPGITGNVDISYLY